MLDYSLTMITSCQEGYCSDLQNGSIVGLGESLMLELRIASRYATRLTGQGRCKDDSARDLTVYCGELEVENILGTVETSKCEDYELTFFFRCTSKSLTLYSRDAMNHSTNIVLSRIALFGSSINIGNTT